VIIRKRNIILKRISARAVFLLAQNPARDRGNCLSSFWLCKKASAESPAAHVKSFLKTKIKIARGSQKRKNKENGTVLYAPDITVNPFALTNQNTTNDFYGLAIKPNTTQAYAVGEHSKIHWCIGASRTVVKNVFTSFVQPKQDAKGVI